jgi:unsaturated chondroitin disaccharide hydrolase
VADWYLANVPLDLVCFREFRPGSDDAPRDTSATAIAAAALVKLARAGGRYRTAAAEIRRFSSPPPAGAATSRITTPPIR